MKAGSFLGLCGSNALENADKDSFRFHITWKAMLRMALKLVKIPPEWTEGLTGNAKVLWEDVFMDYVKCEGKEKAGDYLGASDAPAAQHRFDIMSKVIPAGIIIYFQDSAYREVGDRLLYKIIQNQHKFHFPPHHLDPDCWYKDGTADTPAGRLTFGMVIPDGQIVSADENVIVVKEILPPKKYFASIEGIDHWVSINSNYPQYLGNGWAYRVLEVYGTQTELERKILVGD